MRKAILFFIATGIFYAAYPQIMAGASVGTFNIHGAGEKFKGVGPTIKLEYGMSDDKSTSYLDGSLYIKRCNSAETTITDSAGVVIGQANTKAYYSIKHLQLGLKRMFARDVSEKGLSFFFGGGIAVSSVKTTYKYTLPGYNIAESKITNTLFGFHFNGGAQYNFDPIIIELKGNLDLMLKPLVTGDSYAISTTRLGVTIPLTKQ
jgi:hypothetical protein